MDTELKKPMGLEPGSKVAVVSTAGPPDTGLLERGIGKLEQMGLEVVHRGATRSVGYLADDDRQRAALLQEALADPDIRAVICSRGGYGSMRLLPHIELSRFGNPPKILVGSSDNTFLLHAYQIATGTVVFHGPMAATSSFVEQEAGPESVWRDVLFGSDDPLVIEHPDMAAYKGGKVAAPVTGGCLSLLVASLGTPYEPDFSGRILFLEDRGEPPYRIDRMLAQLRLAGKLDGIRGLILGGLDVESVDELTTALDFALGDVSIPVVHGFPAGHGPVNTLIPMGTVIELDADLPRVTYLERAVD